MAERVLGKHEAASSILVRGFSWFYFLDTNSGRRIAASASAGAQPVPVGLPCWFCGADAAPVPAVLPPMASAPEPVEPVPSVPDVSSPEPPPITPRFSHPEPSVEEGALPPAGVICTWGVGPVEPLLCVVVVVVVVVLVVAVATVVVPPTGMVSPTLTVVLLAQHPPEKRARQSENISIACVACIISH